MKKILIFLKNLLPWGMAALLFTYLFNKYPIGNLLEGARYVNLPLFLGFSLLYFLFIWIADCWGLARLFSRIGFPTKTRELLSLRLASYSIMIVNYGAAQGALAYFFKREKKMPFLKSASLVSFMMVIDLYWIVSLALVGSLSSGFVIKEIDLDRYLWSVWLLFTVGLLLLMILSKLPTLGRHLNWLRDRHLFLAFREARLTDYLHAFLVRAPLHLAVNTSLYFFAMTFGVKIPLLQVITYLPIILMLGTLPLTPGGLGLIQILMVEFFQGSVRGPIIDMGLIKPAELIFLITLSAQLLNFLFKASSGLFVFKKVMFQKKPIRQEAALS